MQIPYRYPAFAETRSGTVQLADIYLPDNRIGVAEFTVPANTDGPPAHWHEMHDETFLVTK